MQIQTAGQIERTLKKLGTKERAASSAWFFKTKKGEYGYGDIFVGVTVPAVRKLAVEYVDLPLPEITKLLENKVHECRLIALIILVERYKSGDVKLRAKVAKFYIAHTKFINNWDLVDVSASNILGAELLHKKRDVLYSYVTSNNMWERRIAIISTLAFIREGDFADTFNLSGLLLRDQEDLIHKAVGWMLREVGKQSRATLVQFLRQHAPSMPRTALRYSIEQFPEFERKKFLHMK
ncbi:MAG: alkylation repair enzyme protein [Parcubacteria group bacterium GW2011_GWA2_47_7]|nr:MAG: alkylation repair enzyme protein [Parcubacteria group bacterium GW2011_GWA2_47_7]